VVNCGDGCTQTMVELNLQGFIFHISGGSQRNFNSQWNCLKIPTLESSKRGDLILRGSDNGGMWASGATKET